MTSANAQPVYVITGAGGISSATARQAIERGAAVFIISRDEPECRTLNKELLNLGGTAAYAVADLTQEAAVADAAAAAHQRFGRLDGLFNSAGISGRRFGDGPLHECSTEGWRHTLAANLDSHFFMSRAVLKLMLAQPLDATGRRGSIVNMASVLAFSPRADLFATHAYAASKAAILGMTKAMAAYYAPHKIRVNAVAPGLVRTPMSARAQNDPTVLQLMKIKQPLPEDLIDPMEVAAAALFLLSNDSPSITGETLSIDGGWCVSG